MVILPTTSYGVTYYKQPTHASFSPSTSCQRTTVGRPSPMRNSWLGRGRQTTRRESSGGLCSFAAASHWPLAELPLDVSAGAKCINDLTQICLKRVDNLIQSRRTC